MNTDALSKILSSVQSSVSSLSETNTQLADKVERQVQALSVQDEIINEGYVKIGSKKELEAAGLLSGGFMKKTKVNYDNLQKNVFNKIDIRNYKEVTISSKNPKILTKMPASSYSLTKNGNGTSTLKILDPTAFWSVSNFLIIQTN